MLAAHNRRSAWSRVDDEQPAPHRRRTAQAATERATRTEQPRTSFGGAVDAAIEDARVAVSPWFSDTDRAAGQTEAMSCRSSADRSIRARSIVA
jgi:hypothetical protein